MLFIEFEVSVKYLFKISQISIVTFILSLGCAKGALTTSQDKNRPRAENFIDPVLTESPSPVLPDILPLPSDTVGTSPNVKINPVDLKPTPTAKKPKTTVTTPTNASTTVNPSKKNEPALADSNFISVTWDKKIKSGKDWSEIIYSVINHEEPRYLEPNIVQDIEIFCPNYRVITKNQRLNFWGQFFAALAEHESSWNPTSRYVEKNFKNKDSVTKESVVSEGLLQLSYQDEKSYGLNCGFDWAKDRLLSPKDPRKTIFNPYLNLRCGMKIMMHQLKKYGRLTLEKNVYWAVIKKNGQFSKIDKISATTKSLKFCQ